MTLHHNERNQAESGVSPSEARRYGRRQRHRVSDRRNHCCYLSHASQRRFNYTEAEEDDDVDQFEHADVLLRHRVWIFRNEEFHQLLYGHDNFLVESHHKPLESVFKKEIHKRHYGFNELSFNRGKDVVGHTGRIAAFFLLTAKNAPSKTWAVFYFFSAFSFSQAILRPVHREGPEKEEEKKDEQEEEQEEDEQEKDE
ncbi:hypothetical protein DPMN_069068 [Dreissena polymorpha]|uniref:Uncharacterized protein n=1 Tax=Dreissena polymorpha TaxID=45954 RepID=A0A9D3Z3R1_DREPO|nr:hypothetical protein DPMN_069068 [Dreissena polymorpha]